MKKGAGKLSGRIERYRGTVDRVRDVEDAIRSTRQYTIGLLSRRHSHPPLQGKRLGDDLHPAQGFSLRYDVHTNGSPPVDWNQSLADVWKWAMSETIKIRFWYDYRCNEAEIRLLPKARDVLKTLIPDFEDLLAAVGGICRHCGRKVAVRQAENMLGGDIEEMVCQACGWRHIRHKGADWRVVIQRAA